MTTRACENGIEEAVEAFDGRVRALPWRLALDEHSNNHGQLNAMLVAQAYLTGELPYHQDADLRPVDAASDVRPAMARLVRTHRVAGSVSRLYVGDDWIANIVRNHDASVSVDLSAVDEATGLAVVTELRAFVQPVTESAEAVDVVFAHQGRCGAVWTSRRVSAPAWSTIERNYVPPVREVVGALVSNPMTDERPGRLVLLHGPPGTGKTTLVRAIAQEWKSSCSTTIVVDPDRLFNDAGYLFEVVLDRESASDEQRGEQGGSGSEDRWRFLVLEDCDELLRHDAKRETGQALSRLLNLADGVIGQGLRIVICLTTNEPMARLHPALLRPGRCLANVEVRAFTRAEAAAWLRGTGRRAPANGVSLAELYAVARGDAVDPESSARVVGLYL